MEPSLRSTARACALAANLLVLLSASSAWAETGSEEVALPSAFETALTAVVAPPSQASVEALMRLPELEQAPEALRAVGRLWHAGGTYAAEALRVLARHADPGVREGALRGLAVLGLRGEAGSRGERGIRRALTDRDPAVRRAAFEALGRVGVADDVAPLIEGLASPEAEVRSLALRALRTLTGERLTTDPARWAYWWEHARDSLEAQVESALHTLDEQAEELDAAQAWSVLERRAWVAPAAVERRAGVWIAGWDRAQRVQGYRLVVILRSAALAEAVEESARKDATGPAAEACLAAQRALGLLPREV